MRSFEERTEITRAKIEAKRLQNKRNTAITVCLSVVLMIGVFAAILFVPFHADLPDVSMYADNDYYEVIQWLNEVTFRPPVYKNNFEKWVDAMGFSQEGSVLGGDNMMSGTSQPDYGASLNEDRYVETTDNQVEGVIEGDLMKRTDRYIYYLNGLKLTVYSIAGADSEAVGSFEIDPGVEELVYLNPNNLCLYLSEDGTTITVMFSVYGKNMEGGYNHLALVSLDVSDPERIVETGRKTITGEMISNRKVFSDTFLLVSQYNVYSLTPDYAAPETFLPVISDGEQTVVARPDQIVLPQQAGDAQYTVVTMFREGSLELVDTVVFPSYSQQIHVSEKNLFVTRNWADTTNPVLGQYTQTAMTEIYCLGYDETGLTQKGSIALAGDVKNQYAMDEYEGILRVVTSTTVSERYDQSIGGNTVHRTMRTERNVNLTCVNLKDMTIAAQVVGFAPDGERAESVRFDGYTAYVCTAEVITLTDPVYFFDLRDLNNITWKDTGTIEGYSTSLVDFGNNLLVGIGYSGASDLKVEVYTQTEDRVLALCDFVYNCHFSEEYKAYFIDRENQRIGLATGHGERGNVYLLLQFTGYDMVVTHSVPYPGNVSNARADIIDGWLYVMGNHDFSVTYVGE